MRGYWEKLGLIYAPDGTGAEWIESHAAVPIAQHIQDDVFKVYFSSRDRHGRSHTCSVRMDVSKAQLVSNADPELILSPGELGCFDDSGAMATWLTQTNDTQYLYYIGWNLGRTVPFRNAIGLACGQTDGTFIRYAEGPIIDRTALEPQFTASCCVLPGTPWQIWYLACTGWSTSDEGIRHHYHIRYAESDDGVHWIRDGIVAIDFKDRNEYAISRPSVLRDKFGYHMWFSYRGESYRIGYASSKDGVSWTRSDNVAGIDVSETGWDSEMIEYPFVFEHGDELYMLYNGNDFGRSGFGLAIRRGR